MVPRAQNAGQSVEHCLPMRQQRSMGAVWVENCWKVFAGSEVLIQNFHFPRESWLTLNPRTQFPSVPWRPLGPLPPPPPPLRKHGTLIQPS